MDYTGKHDSEILIARPRLAAILLMFGGYIYLAYRDKSLIMFQWVSSLHLDGAIEYIRRDYRTDCINEWLVYSLPDGLWISSFIIIMYCVWRKAKKKERMTWVLSLPLAALVSEIMQLFGWLIGTFDWVDFVCYAIPILIYIIYEYKRK